jgi:hypothetical protein
MSETVKQLKLSHSKLLHGDFSQAQRKNLNDSLLKCQDTGSLMNDSDINNKTVETQTNKEDEASFFDILSKIQSNRLDDQRCSLNVLNNKTNTLNQPNQNQTNKLEKQTSSSSATSSKSSLKSKDFFNFILNKPHKNNSNNNNHSNSATDISNISKIKPVSSVSDVISTSNFSQYSSSDMFTIPSSASTNSITSTPTTSKSNNSSSKFKNIKNNLSNKNKQAITLPSDDTFFSMVQKIQSRRLNEQRSTIKAAINSFKKPFETLK